MPTIEEYQQQYLTQLTEKGLLKKKKKLMR